jgi:hypothetical protein
MDVPLEIIIVEPESAVVEKVPPYAIFTGIAREIEPALTMGFTEKLRPLPAVSVMLAACAATDVTVPPPPPAALI